ncbi:MAG: GNAT family N-acetyltransferase [Oscillospiraceae bacterium]|nr:GNAT family N-acetyltransferase [Oscillospiraceae bacterium]
MELVKITRDNLSKEHICCAISNDKDLQVASKKAWLEKRLDEGLVFLKGNVRGKCFIEYIPAEYAWAPVEADGFMYIDCLWVSGQFKGHGYSSLLLDECVRDSKEKGKKGLVCLSSKKKMGFLSDPKYMRYKGFLPADKSDPYFELLYLPFDPACEKPRFKDAVKSPHFGGDAKGFTLFYTHQCPFTAKYVPLLEKLAREKGAAFQAVHLNTREAAQNAPTPFTTFSLFYKGQFVTHEILSEKKFEKLLADLPAEAVSV